MIDETLLTIRKGPYRFARSGAVNDHILLGVATGYENDVMRKVTALPADQMPRRYPGTEAVLATLKYDGEGVFIHWQKGQPPALFNAPAGGVRLGLPALDEFAALMEKAGIQRALFRAELYLPRRPDTPRSRSSDVNRISHAAIPEDLALLKLAVFDIIMLDGRDLRASQENFTETWTLLGTLIGDHTATRCHRPEGRILPENEVPAYFQSTVSAGDEGLVVRRLQRLEIAKIKPEITIDAVVIGYVEGDVDGATGITSLLTALHYPEKRDGSELLQTFARVGSGFTIEQRRQFLDLFAALRVTAPLAMTDSDGREVHFVRPEILVEIRGEDMVTTHHERENLTQVFAWDGTGFEFPGLAPCPRLVFATFRQLRQDKTLAGGGARFAQTGRPNTQPELQNQTHTPPVIIRREVYVKADAVRKLIVTHQTGTDTLPWLIYWTDYSAKRKDPLKVTTEAALTPDRAEALAEAALAAGITKGFVKQ
jgi:ATP dependent DNA ligase C terminal region